MPGDSEGGGKRYRDKDWLKEKYVDEGLTMNEISTICGVTTSTISKYVSRLDIENEPIGKYRDEEWLREKYYEEIKSSGEIAEMCDVHPGTIITWLHKHDIPVRSNGSTVGALAENRREDS